MMRKQPLIIAVFLLWVTTEIVAQVKMPVSKETRKITYEGAASSELGSIDHNVNKLVGWMNFKGVPISSIKIKDNGDYKQISAKAWFPAYYILKTSVDPRMEERKPKGNYDYFANRGDEFGQIRFDIVWQVYADRVEYTATNFEHFYPNRMAQTCGPLEAGMGKNTTKDYWAGYKIQTISYMKWLDEKGLKDLLSLSM